MKKFLALMLLTLVTGTVTLLASSDLDFKLVNKTGWRIDKIFLSPADKKSWGSDILGENEVFEPNTALNIKFHKSADTEIWDLLCVEPDGTKHEYHNLDLSVIEEMTLYYSDAKGAWATVK